MSKQLDEEDRRQQRLRRLGTKHATCAICGESDPAVLELHHIAGRKHHDHEVILCANCHRKLSDQQRDHAFSGPPPAEGGTAKVGHYLQGLGDLLCLVGPTLRKFGAHLIAETKKDGQGRSS